MSWCCELEVITLMFHEATFLETKPCNIIIIYIKVIID